MRRGPAPTREAVGCTRQLRSENWISVAATGGRRGSSIGDGLEAHSGRETRACNELRS